MRIPIYTKQFKKDIERSRKRGKNLEKIKITMCSIAEGEHLDPIHRDHKLAGDYQGRRECHVESDWLLVYKLEPEQVIFERTGSHSDLFGQ